MSGFAGSSFPCLPLMLVAGPVGVTHRYWGMLEQVQRQAADMLHKITYRDTAIAEETVTRGALPPLIHMLRSPEAPIHHPAVDLITNFVHCGEVMKKMVGSTTSGMQLLVLAEWPAILSGCMHFYY